jgi:hypothetical protein
LWSRSRTRSIRGMTDARAQRGPRAGLLLIDSEQLETGGARDSQPRKSRRSGNGRASVRAFLRAIAKQLLGIDGGLAVSKNLRCAMQLIPIFRISRIGRAKRPWDFAYQSIRCLNYNPLGYSMAHGGNV